MFGMILMGMLVISFAIWGIADIFRGYGSQTLIQVGETEITPQEYARAQQDVLRSMSQTRAAASPCRRPASRVSRSGSWSV